MDIWTHFDRVFGQCVDLLGAINAQQEGFFDAIISVQFPCSSVADEDLSAPFNSGSPGCAEQKLKEVFIEYMQLAESTRDLFASLHHSLFDTMCASVVAINERSARMDSLEEAVADLQRGQAVLRAELATQKEVADKLVAERTSEALLRDVLMLFQSTFLAHFGSYAAFVAVRQHVLDGTALSLESFADIGMPDVPHFVSFFQLLDKLYSDAHPLATRAIDTLSIRDFDALPLTADYNRTHISFFLKRVQHAYSNKTLIAPPRFNVNLHCDGSDCRQAILHQCSKCRTLHCEAAGAGCTRPALQPTQMQVCCPCQPQAECKATGMSCYSKGCQSAPLYAAACCPGVLFCSSPSTTCRKPRYRPRTVFTSVRCANPTCGAVGSMTR